METRPLDETVVYAMMRAAKAYKRVSRSYLSEIGLQPGQDLLLRELWDNDGVQQSELPDRLGVEQPTISKALSRLEKEGLVTRRRDPRDARCRLVYLTASGKQLRGPVQKMWAELEVQGTKGFSPKEKRLLRKLANRICDNLERVE